MMRQTNYVAAALFVTCGLSTAAQSQAWNVIDNARGQYLQQDIPGTSGGRQYQFIIAMCGGNKLAFNFAAARPMKKPEVFVNEGGFGETKFAGDFLQMSDGDPQVISLTPAASQKLRQSITKTERDARKGGSRESALSIGPGGNAAGDTVYATGFSALASRVLAACIK